MKTLQTILLAAAVSLAASSVFADTQTASVGYAQTDVSHGLKTKGANVQYRYEWQSPVSLLTSASYQTGDKRFNHATGYDKWDVDYYSFLAGPAYRFNDLVSVYALGGVAHGKGEHTYHTNNRPAIPVDNPKDTSVAYGAGLIINPQPNLSLNVGYEGTRLKKYDFNGFNVGVGYRF